MFHLAAIRPKSKTQASGVPLAISISAPADGAALSGPAITITALPTGGATPYTGVQFVVESDPDIDLGVDASSPYSVVWDTTTVANGTYSILAGVTDNLGHTAYASINVTVGNVAISAPAIGAVIDGTVTVTATVLGTVSGVQFKIDGVNLGSEDTASPFTTSWDTTAYSIGPHTITATARYASGATVVATNVVFVSHAASTLITGTDGIAFNFTDSTDAQRVSKKVSSVYTAFAPDASGMFNTVNASPKLVYDINGVLVWSPHNMFLNSGTPATQSVTTIIGARYTVKVTGSGSLVGSSGASGTATAASPLTYVATGTTSTFTLSGSLTTIQMNRGTVATAYMATTANRRFAVPITYDPLTHVPMGAFSELVATNSLLWSTDLANVIWVTTGGITAAAATSPNGLVEAFKLGYVSGTSISLTQDFAGTVTGTLSIHAHADVLSQIVLYGSASAAAGFDLLAGTTFTPTSSGVAMTLAGNPRIQNIGNGWFRCSVDAAALGDVTFRVARSNEIVLTVAPGADAGIFVYGPQLEGTNVIATSYIPTFDATVTRATDGLSIPTASTAWNSSFPNSIAVYGMGSLLNGVVYVAANDGTDNNRISIDTGTNTRQARLAVISSATTYVDAPPTGTVPTLGVYYRAAAAIAANDCAISVDGAAVSTDTSLTLPAGTNSISITNARSTGGKQAYVRTLVIEPRRMPNSELVTRSTA